MTEDPLALALILLAATVVVVTLARRAGLPAILGYLCVGALLGPYAFGAVRSTETTQLLSELGVVFLLFTLGLEFSWPRMVAMRRDVFGIGTAQVVLTATAVAGIAWLLGTAPLPAIAIGGAIAMSSTAIILQQLTEQSEINRTHGRIAFGVLLFQDLAFVPFLVLAGALTAGDLQFSPTRIAASVGVGALAVAAVVFAGRFLLRPLLYEIAHSRLRELFTLAVLMVALGAAWVSHAAGVSMATGAFLAGMMLSETEYRHQIESVIKPFRDILLGLFVRVGRDVARRRRVGARVLAGRCAIRRHAGDQNREYDHRRTHLRHADVQGGAHWPRARRRRRVRNRDLDHPDQRSSARPGICATAVGRGRTQHGGESVHLASEPHTRASLVA
jgi:CPA2 family monovalent cation:H+ antiporter-2